MECERSIYGEIALISGRGAPGLSREISETLGVPLTTVSIGEFPNQNIYVQLQESVRARDVFIIQPTCKPVNRNLVELLILIDTVRRASAGRITAVMPFYAYARSDKKDKPRVPITARLVADMVCAAGASRFMTVDLHAGQIQGFFDIPGDELTVFPLLSAYIAGLNIPKLVVVAADLGFAKKARNFAEALHAPVAFVEKRRKGTETDSLTVIGDVRDCNVVIVDDEVDVGGTMLGAAHILRQAGAKDIYASFVHPTFSDGAIANLMQAGFRQMVCTNTEPITRGTRAKLPNLCVIHLGEWLGNVIGSVHRGESVAAALSAYQPDYSRICD